MKLSKNSLWLRTYRALTQSWAKPSNLCDLLTVVFLRGGLILALLAILTVMLGFTLWYLLGSLGLIIAHFVFNYAIDWKSSFITAGLTGWSFFTLLAIFLGCENLYKKYKDYKFERSLNNDVAKPDSVLVEWWKGFKGNFCPTIEIVD